MNVAEIRLAGLAALLAVSVAATGGCGVADAGKESAAPASAKPLQPRDALLASLPDASTGSFRFTIEGGEAPSSGEIDASRQSYRVGFRYREPKAGFTLLSDYLVVKQQSWIKIRFTGTEGLTGLPKLPKKWMLIDPAKVKTEDVPLAYDNETDPGEAGAVLRAIVAVEQTSPGHFAGTTDLTQQGDAEIVGAARLRALGRRPRRCRLRRPSTARAGSPRRWSGSRPPARPRPPGTRSPTPATAPRPPRPHRRRTSSSRRPGTPTTC
jgi:hypothetical protein